MTIKICLWVCAGSLLASSGASGCHPKPAVVVEAPVAPASAPPPPPPPPPPAPSCEALAENCTATEATSLAIGEQGAALTPPPGWKFAKLADRSLAVSPEGMALLTAAEISSSTETVIFESLERLSQASALEKVKFETLKKRFKKPQITVDGRDTKVDLWEIGKSTGNAANPELRDRGAGRLLAFVARLTDDRVITGLGFVVVPDAESDAEKVMNAVRSLRGKP